MSDRIVTRTVIALGLLAVLIPNAHAADGADVSALFTIILATAGIVALGVWAVYRIFADHVRDRMRIQRVVRRYAR